MKCEEMSNNFKCVICNKNFKYKLVKDFHLDHKHNIIIYECELCGEQEFKTCNQISLLHLLDHIYEFHDENIYYILDYLHLF